MKEQLNVALVFRSGGDYCLGDVWILANRIRKVCLEQRPVTVYCFSDHINVEQIKNGVTFLPLRWAWEGWWSKMELFRPAWRKFRPFLYLDLDTAVVNPLEDLIAAIEPNKFTMLRDFHHPERFGGSGLMWVPRKGIIDKIWRAWKEFPLQHIERLRGDQDFIREVITEPEAYWQDIAPGVVRSYKPTRKSRLTELPPEAAIVCFHGKPSIQDAALETKWVEAYIKNEPEKNLPADAAFVREEMKLKRKGNYEIDARICNKPWISVLCPTRERPEMMLRAAESMFATAGSPDRVELLIYIDANDPDLQEYLTILSGMRNTRFIIGPSDGVGKAWNRLAIAAEGRYLMMGNDDLVWRTENWEGKMLSRLVEFPDQIVLAWANDGKHEGKYCAFPMISARWVKEVGQFVPECFEFFYHDTWLFDIIGQIGMDARKIYCDDVLIEHCHFTFGKSKRDATTTRNRNSGQNGRDKDVYEKTKPDRNALACALRQVIYTSANTASETFEQVFAGKRVALVGPAPHLQRAGLGELIDGYDVVCRINEVHPFGLEDDYGSRTDAIFHCANMHSLSRFEAAAKETRWGLRETLRLFAVPQLQKDGGPGGAEQAYVRTLLQYFPNAILSRINPVRWEFWRHWIGTHPNTGILAICMIMDFPPAELFITGFSFYRQGMGAEDRHHQAYIDKGGDATATRRMTGGHVQEPQAEWFKSAFLPRWKDVVRLDSYLVKMLHLSDWKNAVPVEVEDDCND